MRHLQIFEPHDTRLTRNTIKKLDTKIKKGKMIFTHGVHFLRDGVLCCIIMALVTSLPERSLSVAENLASE
jgi:hypothetical protein